MQPVTLLTQGHQDAADAPGPVSKQIFSLAVSCLKAAAVACLKSSISDMGVFEQCLVILQCAVLLVGRLPADLAFLLSARSLVLLGIIADMICNADPSQQQQPQQQQQQQQSQQQQQQQQQSDSYMGGHGQKLQDAATAKGWAIKLAQCGKYFVGSCNVLFKAQQLLVDCTGATDKALQQLQQQQVILQLELLQPRLEQYWDTTQQPNSTNSSSSSSSAAHILVHEMRLVFASPAVPQQLQQFGAAVCHQLPIPLWCCHPACINMQCVSELQLVGGKGCVCSSCRSARFCSVFCLQQCWNRQGHRPVCKRIAAAAAGAAAAMAATAVAAPAAAAAAAGAVEGVAAAAPDAINATGPDGTVTA
jgi:hypothetical protein